MRVISIIFGLMLSTSVLAQTLGDQIIKEGVGVRALGMGGAFSAVADDASALYYNPAGLAEPGVSYSFGNLDTEQRQSDSTFNLLKLGFLGYSTAGAKNATGDTLNLTAIGFGDRTAWLNWGANYKSEDWTTSGTRKNGWTADIGFLVRLTPKVKLGLVAQDLLTSKDRVVPTSARLGLSFKPFDGQLLIAADAEIYRTLPTYGHVGLEASLAKGCTIRGGVDRGDPTAGLSLDLGILAFDYGVLFPPDGKNIQRFEIGLKYLPEKERPFSLIKPKEFALIDISGSIKGGLTEFSFFGGVRPGLDSILEQIRNATKDSSVDGIMLRLGGFSGGLGGSAVVQEMREELKNAQTKGKKVVAYIEGSALGDEYYLASVADKVVAAPGTVMGGLGKSLEIYRMAGVFEKFGIEWKVLTKGKYKSSFDWLSPTMSADQKKMLTSLNEDLFRQMITGIADSRKLNINKVKKLGDGSIFPAKEAKKKGLIDQVGYFRDALATASDLCQGKEEAKLVEPCLVEPEETLFSQVVAVAVIEVNGEIVSGGGGQNIVFGGSYVGSDTIVRHIRQASDDMLVKAIILRIDSPGGSSIAAGEIRRALQYAKEKNKVVIASFGSIAASAGYYIGSCADQIVADPACITGSIGVISYLPNMAELLKKYKVKVDVVKEGEHTDMFSGARAMTAEEVKSFEKVMEESYRDFINVVAEGRQLPTKEVEKLAGGYVYTGAQALDQKLVDKLGGFSTALNLAKEKAGITGDPRLVYYRDLGLFWQLGQGVTSALGLPPGSGWLRN